MRLILRSVVALLVSGHLLGAFAQDQTVRSGFAIATLVSGNVAGLIATASLTNTAAPNTGHAIIAPSPLLTAASLLVPVGPPGGNTTAIAMANPSAGTGGVNLIFTDNAGNVIVNTTVTLGSFGHFSRYVNDFFGTPPEFSTPLLLTMSSEIPVAIVALNFQAEDFTPIPFTSLSAPTAVPGGSPALVFPEVATGGGWVTQIVIGNTSTAQQVMRIDFFDEGGANTASVTDIIIQPRGLFILSR